MPKKVLILGAAGRDFHNFNVFFRNNPDYEVVGFTATQIPAIEGRKYPPALSGSLYPDGISIFSEGDMEKLIKESKVDVTVFAYSDVSHNYVMHLASKAMSAGSDFWLMGPESTMIKSRKPVIAVGAVRTGSGKSQTTRRIGGILKQKGKRLVVVRHSMPYGDLTKQVVQKFSSLEDLDRHNCTIEEREEYEPHIRSGITIFAGVDYQKILEQAEEEADIILWDGGNNDFPFYRPSLFVVVADPLRVGHESLYHPGETNIRMADVCVINKLDSASFSAIEKLRANIRELNPGALIVEAASPVFVEDGAQIRGRKALVVEDGPTLTHGEMGIGAGYIAALKFGAREVVSPKPYAVGSIKETFQKYPNVEWVLPAMGYGKSQLEELQETINRTSSEIVVIATPVNLASIIKINKPCVRVRYELQEIGEPTLKSIIDEFIEKL